MVSFHRIFCFHTLQHTPMTESLAKELPKFCFPFVSERFGEAPVVIDDRDTFTFVLTEESGIQQFGYCRHIKVYYRIQIYIYICLHLSTIYT